MIWKGWLRGGSVLLTASKSGGQGEGSLARHSTLRFVTSKVMYSRSEMNCKESNPASGYLGGLEKSLTLELE